LRGLHIFAFPRRSLKKLGIKHRKKISVAGVPLFSILTSNRFDSRY